MSRIVKFFIGEDLLRISDTVVLRHFLFYTLIYTLCLFLFKRFWSTIIYISSFNLRRGDKKDVIGLSLLCEPNLINHF